MAATDTSPLHCSLVESMAKAGSDGSFIPRFLSAISGYTRYRSNRRLFLCNPQSHTPPRSIHIDTAELDRRLLSIHKSNHSLPPPQLKRGRSGQPLAVQSLQPAPPHEGLMRDRVLSDVRLLVEHLLLQPRDQHRSSSVAFANLRTQQRQPFA